MRTAPALHVTVACFDRWRAGLAGATAVPLAAAAGAWWAAAVPAPLAAASCLFSIVLAAALWRTELQREPHVLHWDGQAWHWAAAQVPADRRCAGRIEVALDLGRWMLLRLLPADDSASRSGWLPVQAAGLERSWHALRCALYSPTPAAAPVVVMNLPTHER